MTISPHDKQELDQIYSEYKSYGGKKEDYFALLHLEKEWKRQVQEIAHQIAFGGNDYGIDAYYVDREARNLYLYQFKWSENHSLFKDSFDRLVKDGMARVFGASQSQDPQQNNFLLYLHRDLEESRNIIERVYIQFVFKGRAEDALGDRGLDYRKEELESRKHLVCKYFRREDMVFQVEYITYPRIVVPPAPPPQYLVSFKQSGFVESGDGRNLHVGFVKLTDLHGIYNALHSTFLSRNIRAGLSPKNLPNKKIRSALVEIVIKGEARPEVFAFNHNGVTLAAAKLEIHKEAGQATIHEPRLLNGAQTITTFAKFLKDYEGDNKLTSNSIALEQIQVLAKIVEDNPYSDFVTKVTISNNQQNPVDPWTLRANDRIQCDLHAKLIQEVDIFYSHQEAAFENLSDEEREELGVKDRIGIRMCPLAKTFLAMQGKIDRISKMPDVFDGQKSYEDTFRESYLHCDARDLVLIYKISLVLSKTMKDLEESIAVKHRNAIKKAKNLVWALLIQGLLNASDLSWLRDSFGEDLIKQPEFRLYLERLAKTKVLPILKEILADEKYKEKLEAGKYDFLRTQEIFNRCKDIAWSKYGWAKKSL